MLSPSAIRPTRLGEPDVYGAALSMTVLSLDILLIDLFLYVPMGLAFMVPGQLHAVADSNLSAPDYVTI